jgi:hypothetical protein
MVGKGDRVRGGAIWNKFRKSHNSNTRKQMQLLNLGSVYTIVTNVITVLESSGSTLVEKGGCGRALCGLTFRSVHVFFPRC